MTTNLAIFYDKSDEVKVGVLKLNTGDVVISLNSYKCIIATPEQAAELAEQLQKGVASLREEKLPLDFSGDKTKGDAFEALRRAGE